MTEKQGKDIEAAIQKIQTKIEENKAKVEIPSNTAPELTFANAFDEVAEGEVSGYRPVKCIEYIRESDFNPVPP